MMPRWVHTSWGRTLARLLISWLVIQPLWEVSQTTRWDPALLRQLFVPLVDLVRPGVVHAAEANVEIELTPGFNLFAYPVDVPTDLVCTELQAQLGAAAVHRLHPQTRQFETCASPGVNFPIVSGEGYIVEMDAVSGTTVHGEPSCPMIAMPAGLTLIGIPSPPPGLGCFALLQALGPREEVATIQLL